MWPAFGFLKTAVSDGREKIQCHIGAADLDGPHWRISFPTVSFLSTMIFSALKVHAAALCVTPCHLAKWPRLFQPILQQGAKRSSQDDADETAESSKYSWKRHQFGVRESCVSPQSDYNIKTLVLREHGLWSGRICIWQWYSIDIQISA